MNTPLVRALQQLGCSPKEIRFYLANYELGSATLSDINSRAKLQRSTIYVIAEDLIKKQLIFHDHKDYAKKYTAISPQELITRLQSKQRSVKKAELRITEELVSLQAHYGANDILPKVSVHQGKKGLITVKTDILKSKGEILLLTNQNTERSMFSEDEHRKFIDYRIKHNLPIRVLAIDNHEGLAIAGLNPALLREVRLLPSSVYFTTETYMYDDKIAMLDFNTDIISVVIHSQSFARSQREIFEMLWERSA